jgi:beta-ribofuranosylaminobenzene 5'-phosphate synthase
MDGRTVEIVAPSRLHFGMLSFGQPGVRQFGGVGAMVDAPGLRLAIDSAATFSAGGALAERVRRVVEHLVAAGWFRSPPNCRIDVTHAPRPHVGLGSGTQLALSVAAGLNAWLGRPELSAAELARATHRSERSAIGVHGFSRGGLLVEAGKLRPEEISPLVARVELPAAWRFVLLCPAGETGLSGDRERQAFERLPPVPEEVTARLCRLVLAELLPAAATADFDAFSEALARFGRLAGNCFASQQAGSFASPRVAALVERLARFGVRGVAQTSWGPTVAALVLHEAAATELVRWIQADDNGRDIESTIAAPASTGARIEIRGGLR